MAAEQFAYWMQGFAELNGDEVPTQQQWKMIKDHLQTVFTKVTPDYTKVMPSPAIPHDFYKQQTAGSPSWREMPRVECSVASTALLMTTPMEGLGG